MRRLNVSLSRAKKKLILVGHKSTLTDAKFHAEQDVTGIKPHEVFSRLSVSSITFNHKTKADIFVEKYQVGDIIPCIVDSVAENTAYVIFKNDTIFYYPIHVFNIAYLEAIKEAGEVSLKFKRYDANKKPIFDIVSFIDKNGKSHDVISIESYQDIFPVGKEVSVIFTGKDERGDIRVSHYGFQGKIPKNAYPIGFFAGLKEGQELNCRVYYVDVERQRITFCPMYAENIISYILGGQVKNYCCKVINKLKDGNIELEFDSGYTAIFKIQFLWYHFLEVGRMYNSIGYDQNRSCVYVFRDRYFTAFANRYSVGDHVTGKLVFKGYRSVAIADDYPGYVHIGNLNRSRVGDTCDLIINEINEEEKSAQFNSSVDAPPVTTIRI